MSTRPVYGRGCANAKQPESLLGEAPGVELVVSCGKTPRIPERLRIIAAEIGPVKASDLCELNGRIVGYRIEEAEEKVRGLVGCDGRTSGQADRRYSQAFSGHSTEDG